MFLFIFSVFFCLYSVVELFKTCNCATCKHTLVQNLSIMLVCVRVFFFFCEKMHTFLCAFKPKDTKFKHTYIHTYFFIIFIYCNLSVVCLPACRFVCMEVCYTEQVRIFLKFIIIFFILNSHLFVRLPAYIFLYAFDFFFCFYCIFAANFLYMIARLM